MLLVFLHVLPVNYTSAGNTHLCSYLISKDTASELFSRNKGINIHEKNSRFIRSSQGVSVSPSHLISVLKNFYSVLEIVVQFIAG